MKVIFALLIVLAGSPTIAQTLSVTGLDGHTRTLQARQLKALPRNSVTLKSHEGTSATYEGVPLTAILYAAGAPIGKALRGSDMTDVVVVTASDGYRVAFSLGETDPTIGAEKIVLADSIDGHAIPAPDGPLRLVVAGDVRPARSVRMVTGIRLFRLSRPGRRK